MESLTYKEARSFNRKLRKDYFADKVEHDEYREKFINIADHVRYELTTDAHLPVRLKALFHVSNSNGLAALLSDDSKYGYVNSTAKYHYNALIKLMGLSRPKKWDVNWHIRQLQNVINEMQKEVA